MQKLWLIARNEIRWLVGQRSFALSLVSVPIVLAIFLAIVTLITRLSHSSDPIGYVDRAGLLAESLPAGLADEEPSGRFVALDSEEEAGRALERGDVQAYVVLEADYFQTAAIQLVTIEPPTPNARQEIQELIRLNLLRHLPAETARRAAIGDELVVRSVDGRYEYGSQPTLDQLLPVLAIMGFLVLYMLSANYYAQAVVIEKENRTMELMVTSVSPGQLVGGKALGILAVNLLQIGFWIGSTAVAVYLGGRLLDLPLLQNPEIEGRTLAMLVIIFVPAYCLYAALMLLAGMTVAESQEAQQIGGMFSLVFMAPIWAALLLARNPGSPVVLFLSLFPPTAPGTLALRSVFAPLPIWQLLLSATLMSITAAAVLWLCVRAFRLGMLRYGKSLPWSELWSGRRRLPGSVALAEE